VPLGSTMVACAAPCAPKSEVQVSTSGTGAKTPGTQMSTSLAGADCTLNTASAARSAVTLNVKL
jgi:hypothetical protein